MLADSEPFAGELTLRVVLEDGRVVLELGPVEGEVLKDDTSEPAAGLDLRRLLGTLVDDVGLVEADGARWLRLEKAVAAGAPV